MSPILCITVRFIQPFPLFHGSGDDGVPEWPPSPMRAFQALVNAASLRFRGRPLPPEVESALTTLESIRPSIIAPDALPSSVGYRAYVPHNQADLVSAAWHRGNVDASIASHRMEKDIRPVRISQVGEAVPELHYLFPLARPTEDCERLLDIIRPCVRSISALGWGIDLVAADATLLTDRATPRDAGNCWLPSAQGRNRLRVHRTGSLHALRQRHDRFLNRLVDGQFSPVPPITAVDVVAYARDTDPLARPYAVFKLLDENRDTARYPHAKLIHIAGMVRHLAIERIKKDLPPFIKEEERGKWLETFVCGHRGNAEQHQQISYVPLPSIGHEHADALLRNIMLIAPHGCERELEYVAERIDGEELTPEEKVVSTASVKPASNPAPKYIDRFTPPGGKFIDMRYLGTADAWASVTPVILPGYDDHKPDKTVKLIQRALLQSGVEQSCKFEWSALPNLKNCLSAHKYGRDRRHIGYYRPDHLKDYTAVHLRVEFDKPYPGPLTLGAGRHYGLGLFATRPQS